MPGTSIPEAMPSRPDDCIDFTAPSPSISPSPSPSESSSQSSSQAPSPSPPPPPPASPTYGRVTTRSRSNALSISSSSSTSFITDADLCTICYLPLSTPHAQRDTPERLAALPCGHAFGHICLLQWLRIAAAPTCPTCRMDLVHRWCGHPVMPAAVSAAPPFLVMRPAANKDVAVMDSTGWRNGEGGGRMVRVGLDQQCVLCRGPEGIAAEMLRFERRKFVAEKKMLERLFQMPLSVGMGTPAMEVNALQERIKKMDERWDDAWLRCQDYARLKW